MSMSFMPQVQVAENQWDLVFSQDEITAGSWQGDQDNEVFVPNPVYRPELDMNLSNANARSILQVLGYAAGEDCMSFPIDEFIGRCSSWLQHNLDKPSEAVETTVSGGIDCARVYDIGVEPGYLNDMIHRAAVIAREGKGRGATEMVVA